MPCLPYGATPRLPPLLLALAVCTSCGGSSIEETPANSEPFKQSLVEHLRQEITQDPVADGHVSVFDISPYVVGQKDPDELLSDIESQLLRLQPVHSTVEAMSEEQLASVHRLMASIREGFALVVRRAVRETRQGTSERREAERQAIVDYFGGGTAFPLPNPNRPQLQPTDDCSFVSSHPSPSSPGYVCVLFPQTQLSLGAMLHDSIEHPVRTSFVEALDDLDGDLAGRIVAHHELAHCLHDKQVPRSYTGSMTLRHTESVADVVATLMALRDERALPPTVALADFRTLSAGFRARRGRNTAPAIELAAHEFELLDAQDKAQVADASVSELTQWAEQISFEALLADYPQTSGLQSLEQRDLFRKQGVRTKRLMRFARAALDGQATAADMMSFVGDDFSPRDAALLMRIETVARRTLVTGLTAPLTRALEECRNTWPDIFNQANSFQR